MKFLLVSLLTIAAVSCSTQYIYSNPVLDLERISRMTPVELDELAGGLAAEEIIRTKRSGSGDILGALTKKIKSGVSGKVGLLGQASAAASSFLLSGSSKGHDDHTGYEYGPPAAAHSTKGFDFWTLKKSILGTLFEAVKAIVGGATIIKGQLIKGGGALASGVGKVISVKGEAVSNLGRHLVNNAWLAPPKKHRTPTVVHHESVHVSSPGIVHSSPSAPSHPPTSYGPPSGSSALYQHSPVPQYELPTAPSAHGYYGPPATHNTIYGPPSKYSSPLEGKYQSSPLAGVFVLKPFDSAYGIPDPRTPSSGEPQFVSSAMHALQGILGKHTGYDSHSPSATASSSYSVHPSISISGPSGPSPYSDSLLHPPPPLPLDGNSFTSYSKHEVPAFKPLDIPSDLDRNSDQYNSYGLPLTQDLGSTNSKLQTMVDRLLGIDTAASSKTFFKLGSGTKTTHTPHVFKVYKKRGGLNPVKLSKINDNLDKIKLDRSDRGRSLDDMPSLYEQLTFAKESELLNEKNIDKVDEVTSVSKKAGRALNDEDNDEKGIVTSVEKSITYELRGNRIVKLTDRTPDV